MTGYLNYNWQHLYNNGFMFLSPSLLSLLPSVSLTLPFLPYPCNPLFLSLSPVPIPFLLPLHHHRPLLLPGIPELLPWCSRAKLNTSQHSSPLPAPFPSPCPLLPSPAASLVVLSLIIVGAGGENRTACRSVVADRAVCWQTNVVADIVGCYCSGRESNMVVITVLCQI